MKFIVHADPGHAWIAAPRALLTDLGILDRVSSYSYQRGGTVYLEEDCDAMLLIQTLRARGIEPKFDERHIDRSSPVRSYEHFTAAGPRRALRVGDVIELGPGNVRYQLDCPLGPRRGWQVRRLDDSMLFRMPAKHAAHARIIEVSSCE